MKYFLIVLVFVFAANVEAGLYYPVGKEGAPTYSDLKTCNEKEKPTPCFDIQGKQLAYWDVKTVDQEDKENPIYRSSYKVVACSDSVDCGDKVTALNLPNKTLADGSQGRDESTHCDETPGDFILIKENKLMPGWSFYCTGITGYAVKQVSTLEINQGKKTEYSASMAAEQAKAEKRAVVEKRISFGKEIKLEITIINGEKNLSAQQTQDFVDEFASIGRLLDVGAISAAKDRISNIVTGTSVSSEEKQYILNKMAAFLTGN